MADQRKTATDWNRYYEQPYVTSSYSRSITGSLLCKLMTQYSTIPGDEMSIAELGGANSCFYDMITRKIPCRRYCVFDNNTLGLERFRQRTEHDLRAYAVHQDLLMPSAGELFDLVFSVGLIEHFSVADSAKMIDAHFRYLRLGGIAIISFPTPTWLYRCARGMSELLRMWIFHDERPLQGAEVIPQATRHGELLYAKINWWIVVTQMVIVIRKAETAA